MMRDRGGGGGGGDQLNMKPQEAQHGLNPPPLPLIDRRLKEAPHHHHNNNNHHHQQHHNQHHHHHHHQQQQPQQQQQQIHNVAPANDHQQVLKCPRCDSLNTKFCYYNNYSLLQPRHFCKNCRRYWTKGGALRNVPVGGGCRKNNKRTNTNSSNNNNNNNNNRQKGSASHSFSSSSSTSVAELPPLSSNSHLVPLNTGISGPPHEGGPLTLPESLPPTPLFFNFPSPGGDDMSFPLFTPPSPALIHQQLIRLTPPHDTAMAGSLMGSPIPAAPPTSSHLATLASLNNQLANFGALSLRNGLISLADFGGAMRPPLLQHYGESGTVSGPMPSEVDPFLNEAATTTQPHQLAAVCSLPLALAPTSSHEMQAMAPGSDQQQDAMTNGSFSSAIAAANLQGGHWKAAQQIEQKLANKQQQARRHSGAEGGQESQIIAIESLNNQATIEGDQDQGLLEAGGNNYWTSSGPPSWQDLPTGYAATPSTGPLL